MWLNKIKLTYRKLKTMHDAAQCDAVVCESERKIPRGSVDDTATLCQNYVSWIYVVCVFLPFISSKNDYVSAFWCDDFYCDAFQLYHHTRNVFRHFLCACFVPFHQWIFQWWTSLFSFSENTHFEVWMSFAAIHLSFQWITHIIITLPFNTKTLISALVYNAG